MKRIISILVILFQAYLLNAQSEQVFCVNTCPGEDCSTQMNISWAADSSLNDTYVVLALSSDVKWRKARFFRPSETEFCTVFDGLRSKGADNSDIVEHARFNKLGLALSNLKPDTKYKYYITSGNKLRRNAALTDVYEFKTAGAGSWSACIISDFHNYPPLPKRIKVASDMISTVKNFNPDIDWVLSPGDVCAWGGSYSFWKALYGMDIFRSGMWAGVIGNHDHMSRGYDKNTNEFFKNATYNPRNGYEGEMGVCYWFRYSQVLFVMLNNESMRSQEGRIAAQKYLKKVIEEQKQSDNPPLYTVLVEHYQYFVGPTGESLQYEKWHELFDQLGIDLAIGGNDHVYCRSNCIFDGKCTDGSIGTVYFNTSVSDNERGRSITKDPPANADLIAKRFTEGAHTVSALDMKVDDQRMELTLLDRNGSVIDNFCIKAKAQKACKADVRGAYLRDSLDVFTARCQNVLDAAYMAQYYLGTNDSIPGWEGYPVRLYEYFTGKDINLNGPKRGLVYLLNPDARKLANWIINAVYDATSDLKYEDLETIRKFIKWQSGGQFPVSGVVYEAMYKAGDYRPYLFKDGVTVYIREDHPLKWEDNICTDEQLEYYTRLSNSDLKDYTGRYARIASTNREMYYAAGGKDEVGKDDERIHAWLDTVAKEYKKAWKSEKNFLIYALAKYKLTVEKSSGN